MLKLLFLIFFISPFGKCQDLSNLVCLFPPLTEMCAAAELITIIANIFVSSDTSDDGNEEVIAEISDLREQMEKDHFETMTKLELITDLLRNLPVEIRLDHQKELLASFVSTIDTTFNDFLFALGQKEVEYSKKFANEFFIYKSAHLDELRNDLVPLSTNKLGHEGFFPTLTRSLTHENRVCTGNLAIQETLISMWRMIVKAEVKLYLLLKGFYQITLKKKAYRKRLRAINSKTNEHILAYSRAVRHSLKTVYDLPHDSCDPEDNDWIQDESFYHLDEIHNPVIFKHSEVCSYDSCQQITEENLCDWSWIHMRFECFRGLHSCVPAGYISACVSEWDKPVINWLESSKLGRAGSKDDSCPSETAQRIDIEEPSWISKAMPVSTCLCYCRMKVFEIYTGEIKTRVSDNYVVTGVRFKRNGDVLYLQPQEGKLGVYGKVSDFSWIDLPPIDETTRATITEDQKIVFLDDLRLSQGHVMTGIAFAPVIRRNGLVGFGAVIIGTPYDYKSGTLHLDRGYDNVHFGDPPESNELEFELTNPMHTDMTLPNKPSFLHHNYVTLSSSKYTDDAEASFLPLINAIPVTSEHSPLTGIRLFHKGSEEHAGFISLGVHQAHYIELLDELIEVYAKNGTKILKAGIMKQNIFV